jgi:glucokinase
MDLYEFLRDSGRGEEPAWLNEELRGGQPHAVVTAHGLAGDVPLCVETLRLFASTYGAEAGNLALRCVAAGGVYLGGGIAPKLLPALQSGGFREAFLDKGRFREFLEAIEIRVSLNPRTALLGAAHYARRSARDSLSRPAGPAAG